MLVEQDYELVAVERLQPHPDNPRRGDVDQIAESVDANGFYGAIVVQRSTGYVLAGNHRLLAAQRVGLDRLPVIWVDVDEDRALRILAVDNRANDLADYDNDALAALLSSLDGSERGLEGTGYSDTDLAALLGYGDDEDDSERSDAYTDEPELPAGPPITQPGDMWLLGDHRLLCGDCRDATDMHRLMGSEVAQLAFTSPPYASQRAYDESSAFRPIRPEDYGDWFQPVQALVADWLADDGSWFVNIKAHCDDGQRHLYVMDLVLAHVREWGWRFVDEFCWARNSVPGGWSNRFKNAWEPVYHFCRQQSIRFRPDNVLVETDAAFTYAPDNPKSKTGFFSNRGRPDLAAPGMARPSNVLRIGAETRQTENHSAPFPVALPGWFIRAYTDPGDVVLDPFMGSGSTLLAAHATERRSRGMEISTGYCDVVCRRWQQATGEKPVLERTGEPFDFMRGGSDG